MTTTNGTAPTYAAVPDLLDEERLAIVQAQIKQLLPQIYAFEAAVTALPKEAKQRKEFGAELAHTRKALAGYRAIEAELIERMNGAPP